MAQEGARKGRREAEFQVGLGAQLGEVPRGKLAPQEETKAFAEHQAAAAAPRLRSDAPAEIEQKELTLTASEALHRHLEPGRRVLADGSDAARQVARAVPGFDCQTR